MLNLLSATNVRASGKRKRKMRRSKKRKMRGGANGQPILDVITECPSNFDGLLETLTEDQRYSLLLSDPDSNIKGYLNNVFNSLFTELSKEERDDALIKELKIKYNNLKPESTKYDKERFKKIFPTAIETLYNKTDTCISKYESAIHPE